MYFITYLCRATLGARNGENYEKYEKKFLKVYKQAEYKKDLHFQIFLLEVLIEFARKEGKTQEVLKYYSILHNKFRERH